MQWISLLSLVFFQVSFANGAATQRPDCLPSMYNYCVQDREGNVDCECRQKDSSEFSVEAALGSPLPENCEAGDSWTSDDNCSFGSCLDYQGKPTWAVSSMACFIECTSEEEIVKVDGQCCDTCQKKPVCDETQCITPCKGKKKNYKCTVAADSICKDKYKTGKGKKKKWNSKQACKTGEGEEKAVGWWNIESDDSLCQDGIITKYPRTLVGTKSFEDCEKLAAKKAVTFVHGNGDQCYLYDLVITELIWTNVGTEHWQTCLPNGILKCAGRCASPYECHVSGQCRLGSKMEIPINDCTGTCAAGYCCAHFSLKCEICGSREHLGVSEGGNYAARPLESNEKAVGSETGEAALGDSPPATCTKGQKWTSADFCSFASCDIVGPNGEGAWIIGSMACLDWCPAGQTYVKVPGQCCGQCEALEAVCDMSQCLTECKGKYKKQRKCQVAEDSVCTDKKSFGKGKRKKWNSKLACQSGEEETNAYAETVAFSTASEPWDLGSSMIYGFAAVGLIFLGVSSVRLTLSITQKQQYEEILDLP